MCGGQRIISRIWFSLPTMWVLGIQLGSSGLAVRVVTCWVISLAFVFETEHHVFQAGLQCNIGWRWMWISNPASTTWVLELQCGHHAQFYHLPDIEPSTLNSVLQKIRQILQNVMKMENKSWLFKKEGEKTSGAFPDYPWRGECLGLGLEVLLSRP